MAPLCRNALLLYTLIVSAPVLAAAGVAVDQASGTRLEEGYCYTQQQSGVGGWKWELVQACDNRSGILFRPKDCLLEYSDGAISSCKSITWDLQKKVDAEILQKAENQTKESTPTATRNESLDAVVSAKSLLMQYRSYPDKGVAKAAVEALMLAISGNSMEELKARRDTLLIEIQKLRGYAELSSLSMAEEKTKPATNKKEQDEESQSIVDNDLRENQTEEKATGQAQIESSPLPQLEPLDKVYVTGEPTNIRAEPTVTAKRTGSLDAGVSVTVLGQVKGANWYFVEYGDAKRGYVFAPILNQKMSSVAAATPTTKTAAAPQIAIDYGKYYAIVIGNNDYRTLTNLQTAINDARSVANLLTRNYDYEVELLINATRMEIFSALAHLRRTVTQKENLLIYYAGHGWLDREVDEGYWLPVDAAEEDRANWISNADIVASIRRIQAKHLLVVADSCFSGTLTRNLTITTRTPEYLQGIVKKKSRTALTSGGWEPVTDVSDTNHSVFANAFLSILKDNTAILDGHQLFTTLRKQVMMDSDQTPEYGNIRKSGHDGGDFLFVRRN